MKELKSYFEPASENNGFLPILFLEGDLSIASIEQFYKALFDAKDTVEPLTIRCQNVEAIDLASVQVLMAFQKTAKKQGKDVEVVLDLPEKLHVLLSRSGLSNQIFNLNTNFNI